MKSQKENLEILIKKQQSKRKILNDEMDNMKDSKLLEFDVKKKEIDWLLELYNGGEEFDKIHILQSDLESEMSQWLLNFEKQCIEKERKLDDEEQEEDDRFERSF
jgi:hypothetical protein